ncbi:molybdopterin-dependent oxidoreductase [Streptomyces reniochalinae]|uniref:Molybdopterin-binding oxidoreductase n=1 Tax=Streptomyces reniochalinae TaxID=2250578 RepID=A0A367EDE9_9ACTN|nr:molybdopterin-dependent oxidoreductase [Streptomyces reniochalinae]RCG15789.1 molybdopterin-binding oxidoreductase [Streptomyces reniochalinae]
MRGVSNERKPRIGALTGALGALSGVIAGCGALAVAELASVPVRPEAGPVTAVGGAVIDRVPAPVKDFAIRTFGTDDKLVLQLGIVVLLALFAVALGVLAVRHRPAGSAGVLLFGAVGGWAAAGRPDGSLVDALPSVVGAVAGSAVLYALTGLLRPSGAVAEPVAADGTSPVGAPPSVEGTPCTSVTPSAGDAPTEGAGSDDSAKTDGAEAEGCAGAEDGAGPVADDSSAAEGAATSADPAPAGGDRNAPTGPGKPRLLLGKAPDGAGFDRRRFVLGAGAAWVGAAGVGLLGRGLNSRSGAEAVASRTDLTLPAPVSRAAPVPRGAELDIDGLSRFVTSNNRFYRVDTLLRVPKLSAADWSLRIHGKGVRDELTLDYDQLLERGLVERDATLTCVSNQVGGEYVGNARWLGVPLAPLLREAGVRPPSKGGPADQLVARSEDGMTLGSPVDTVMDGRDAMLAVGMNGEPLPFEHGFPVRMVVPGLYGYVSACKWIRELELTSFDDFDVYWVERDWGRRAPIKTQSRIDTPGPLAGLKAGKVAVAGVAWAQHRGIDRVEVRVDDGPWHTARLAEEDSRDTWRQWVWEWNATPGSHELQVRATDRTGHTQTADRVGTVPDGATGRHSVVVDVT